MKKFLVAFILFSLSGIMLVSCSKEDEDTAPNSLTIQGEFTVGEKTYTNPTFNLGNPDNLTAFLAEYVKGAPNTIVIENEDIDLGNNIHLDYDLEIYSAEPGTDINMYAWVYIYENLAKGGSVQVYSESAKAVITKVGEVGGYIEGTFEGDFFYPGKGLSEGDMHIKGKFKVKRIEPEATK